MGNTFYDPGEQRSARVNALFRQIASRYDLVNDIQSAGLHRLWKRRVAEFATVAAGHQALDVCCGTGDIAQGLAGFGADIVGIDFTGEMLAHAKTRIEKAGVRKGKIQFVQADAQKLPFPANRFDAVTIGYGLRNLPDWQAGLKEMLRVAKSGGRLVILEFGKPRNLAWRFIYVTYLRLVVPLFGLLFYANPGAYHYILESLNHYPSQLEVADYLRQLGLANVKVQNILGGAMSIHHAEKTSARLPT